MADITDLDEHRKRVWLKNNAFTVCVEPTEYDLADFAAAGPVRVTISDGDTKIFEVSFAKNDCSASDDDTVLATWGAGAHDFAIVALTEAIKVLTQRRIRRL